MIRPCTERSNKWLGSGGDKSDHLEVAADVLASILIAMVIFHVDVFLHRSWSNPGGKVGVFWGFLAGPFNFLFRSYPIALSYLIISRDRPTVVEIRNEEINKVGPRRDNARIRL